MADERSGVASRPIDLAGDSPELIAFGLLRYLAQLEQEDDSVAFDRAWLLDAYAECLEAVTGKRKAPPSAAKPSSSRKTGSASARRK